MAAIYRDLAEDHPRTSQVTEDVCEALARGRHCLVLTQWTAHLERLTEALQDAGHDPVVLRGGMGAKARTSALARLQPDPGQPPLLAVATGSYIGEGFDCPALDTLFLAVPDTATSVLAASLAKRSAGSPASASPTPAVSLTHPVRAQPGKSLTHSFDIQCAIAGTQSSRQRDPDDSTPRVPRSRSTSVETRTRPARSLAR